MTSSNTSRQPANIIKVDIDKDCRIMQEYVDDLIEIYNTIAPYINLPLVVEYSVTCSQSGNTHVIVVLERGVDSCIAKYVVARLLGDDPLRSLLNLSRCIRLGTPLDILFARKERRIEEGRDNGAEEEGQATVRGC